MAPRGTAAQKAEAAGDDKVTFEYDGDTYTVDADLDLDVLERIQSGKDVEGLRAMLGDAQYAMFRKNHSKTSQLNAFYRAYNAAGLGNS